MKWLPQSCITSADSSYFTIKQVFSQDYWLEYGLQNNRKDKYGPGMAGEPERLRLPVFSVALGHPWQRTGDARHRNHTSDQMWAL